LAQGDELPSPARLGARLAAGTPVPLPEWGVCRLVLGAPGGSNPRRPPCLTDVLDFDGTEPFSLPLVTEFIFISRRPSSPRPGPQMWHSRAAGKPCPPGCADAEGSPSPGIWGALGHPLLPENARNFPRLSEPGSSHPEPTGRNLGPV